jgi:hypothetical protein
MSTVRWTEPTVPVHGSMDSSFKGGRRFLDQRAGLKQRRGISSFNLIRSFWNGWPQRFLLHWNRWDRGPGGAAMPPSREALAHCMRLRFLIWKLLHDLDSDRYPFWPLTTVETDHGKLATERLFGRCLVTVRAVSGEASAPGTISMMVLTTGSPPPSSSLMQRGLDSAGQRREVRRQWRLGLGVATALGTPPIYNGKGPS